MQTTCGCRSCHDVDVCTQDRVDHLCSVKDAQSLDEHRSRATHSAAVGKKGQRAEDAEDDYDSGSFFGPRKSTADDVERAERNRERALDGQRAARAQRTVSQLMGRLDRIEKRFTAGKAQSLLEKIIEGADKVEEEDAKAHPIVMAYQAAVKAAAYVPPEHRAEYMMRYVIAALHGESEAPELPFPGRQPPSLRSKLTKSINIAPERATKHYPWPNKYEVIETPASREQYVPDGPEATNLMALRDEMAELIALTRANKNAGVASLLINGPPKVRLRSVPLLPEPTSSVREIAEIAERSMSILISPKSRRLEMRARGRMSEARGRMKTLKKQRAWQPHAAHTPSCASPLGFVLVPLPRTSSALMPSASLPSTADESAFADSPSRSPAPALAFSITPLPRASAASSAASRLRCRPRARS